MSIGDDERSGIADSKPPSYGAINVSNAQTPPQSHTVDHSPRATITSLLDITQTPSSPHHHCDPTDSDDSLSNDVHIAPPALCIPNVPTITVLNKEALLSTHSLSAHGVITKMENDKYLKQQHVSKSSKSLSSLLNASTSSISVPFPFSDLGDVSHHIEHHALRPCIHGTPHHNEAHLKHPGESPIKQVIFNMLNSIIGAGVVGLPFVYNTAGLFGGLTLMLLFAFISAYSLKLLIISAKLCRQRNYEDLCEYLFGMKGYLGVSITMLVFDFGATLSYLIILGDAASQIIAIWGYDSLSDRQLVITVVSVFVILPTVLPRDISKIEKVSTLSVLSVVLIMAVVIYEWIAYRFLMLQWNEGYRTHLPENMNWGVQPQGIPMAIGIIAFAFVCHDSSFLLYNTLRNPTVARWSVLAYSGCFTAVLICACFAVPGYLTFGDQVNANILNNYDLMNPLIIAARCVYCITMALTYPCSFFVVRHVFYALFHHGPEYQSITTAPLWKHLLFTLPIFALNVLMGIYIQNLGIVMSVSGSLSAVTLAFILPPLCYLKICDFKIRFWKERGCDRKWRALKTTGPPFVLLVFGILVAIFSTGLTLAQYYGLRFD